MTRTIQQRHEARVRIGGEQHRKSDLEKHIEDTAGTLISLLKSASETFDDIAYEDFAELIRIRLQGLWLAPTEDEEAA